MSQNQPESIGREVGRRLVKILIAIVGCGIIGLSIGVTTGACGTVDPQQLYGEWVKQDKDGSIGELSFETNHVFKFRSQVARLNPIAAPQKWACVQGTYFVDWDKNPARLDVDWGHGCIFKMIVEVHGQNIRLESSYDGIERPEKFTDNASICVRVNSEKLLGEWIGNQDGHTVSLIFGQMSAVTIRRGENLIEGTYLVDWDKKPAYLDMDFGTHGRTKTILEVTSAGIRLENNNPGNARPGKFTDNASVFSKTTANGPPSHLQEREDTTPATQNEILRAQFLGQVDQVLAKLQSRVQPSGPIPRDLYDDMVRNFYNKTVARLNDIPAFDTPFSSVSEYVKRELEDTKASAQLDDLRAASDSNESAVEYAKTYTKTNLWENLVDPLDVSYAKAKAHHHLLMNCISNLKQIGLGIAMYSDNYSGAMPPYFDVLSNVVQNAIIYVDPKSGKRFVYIGQGHRWNEGPDVVVAYSPTDEDGREVLFSDGHVTHMSSEEFAKLATFKRP